MTNEPVEPFEGLTFGEMVVIVSMISMGIIILTSVIQFTLLFNPVG